MFILGAIQIDVFSLLLLLIISFTKIQKAGTKDTFYFNHLIYSTACIFLLDLLMFVVDGKSVVLNTLVTFLYYFFTPFVGFFGMMYLLYKIHRSNAVIKKAIKCTLPFGLFYLIVLILSLKTGWVFKINSSGVYSRGEIFWVCEVLCLLMLLFPAFEAIKVISKTQDKATRKLNRGIIILLIPPFLGGIIQFFVYGVSTNWIGMFISIFIIFINYQNEAITTDPLTGINNRRVLYPYMENKATFLSSNQRMFAIVIDIDKFKSINDTYGHAAGDDALIYITEILKEACYLNNDFIARLGGDEFTIICIRDSDSDVSELIEIINTQIKKFNELKCAEYKLSLSIGSAEFGKNDTLTVDNLMKKADNLMYENKRKSTRLE